MLSTLHNHISANYQNTRPLFLSVFGKWAKNKSRIRSRPHSGTLVKKLSCAQNLLQSLLAQHVALWQSCTYFSLRARVPLPRLPAYPFASTCCIRSAKSGCCPSLSQRPRGSQSLVMLRRDKLGPSQWYPTHPHYPVAPIPQLSGDGNVIDRFASNGRLPWNAFRNGSGTTWVTRSRRSILHAASHLPR